jgi:hypothetical protein
LVAAGSAAAAASAAAAGDNAHGGGHTVKGRIGRGAWMICAYGAASVQVMRRMTALLSELIRALPDARRPALVKWQRRIESSINRHFADTDERRDAFVGDRQGLGVSNRSAA